MNDKDKAGRTISSDSKGATPATRPVIRLSGADKTPWFPNMAEVMDRDFDLLDELVTEWATGKDRLDIEDFKTYIQDQTVGRELSPDQTAMPLRSACWLMFLAGYWGGLQMGRDFRQHGPSRGADEGHLIGKKQPTAETFEQLCSPLRAVHQALEGSDTDKLSHLDRSLRLKFVTGTLHGTAYNTGFFEPLMYHPPKGALPSHLIGNPEFLRAGDDRLLEIEYQFPVKKWLSYHKQRHAVARERNPKRWAEVVAGDAKETSLHELWQGAYRHGAYNWGGDTLLKWTQERLDQFLDVSAWYNMRLEGISHAVMATLVDPDNGDIDQATRASALFVPSWLGAMIGIGDEVCELPTLSHS